MTEPIKISDLKIEGPIAGPEIANAPAGCVWYRGVARVNGELASVLAMITKELSDDPGGVEVIRHVIIDGFTEMAKQSGEA